MLAMKGKESSTVYTSDENRLRICPSGKMSKNTIFAYKIKIELTNKYFKCFINIHSMHFCPTKRAINEVRVDFKVKSPANMYMFSNMIYM